MASEGLIFSSGIPTLDQKFGKGGWHIGNWIALVGEPGAMKTLTCIVAMREWLSNNEGYCALYVTTETTQESVVQQFIDFGFDPTDYIESGQLSIVDLFSITGFFGNRDADMKLCRKVQESVRAMAPFQKDYNGKILLVIDSLAPLWQHSPAICRTMLMTITRILRNVVDMAILTTQFSVGTKRAFGFGTEHGIDVLVRLGSYFDRGDRTWINVSKCRSDSCNKGIFDYRVNGNHSIVVGDEIVPEGQFKDVFDALESLKYKSINKSKIDRNDLLKQQNELLSHIFPLLEKISAGFEREGIELPRLKTRNLSGGNDKRD